VRVDSGTVVAHVSWVSDSDTSYDALRGRIEYLPAPVPGRSCNSIRFVQIARVQRNGGSDYEWTLAESARNLLKTPAAGESGIIAGYYVDHRAAACTFERPCSPYYRDSWANPRESRDGFQRGHSTAVASLVDYPYGWDTVEQISLESCARCVDSGAFLGCADWGARWPRQGARDISPIQVHQRPSETFLAALDRFEAFYSGRSSHTHMVRASR
jgi:hypothetical protein